MSQITEFSIWDSENSSQRAKMKWKEQKIKNEFRLKNIMVPHVFQIQKKVPMHLQQSIKMRIVATQVFGHMHAQGHTVAWQPTKRI